MLNSLTLRQQHFLYQRKNLYVPILGRIFSGEPDSVDNHWRLFHLKFFLFLCSPYFIWESVVDAGVSQDSAERVRMFLTMAIYRKLGIHVQGQEMSARLSL